MMNRFIQLLAVALAAALLLCGGALAEGPVVEDESAIELAENAEAAVAGEEAASDMPFELPEVILYAPDAGSAEETPAVQSNAAEFVIEGGVLAAYNGRGGNVVVPNGVTAIGEDAFDGCDTVKRITLPAGVKTIGEGAFCWCRNLVSVTIPDGLTAIHNRAFEGCIALEDLMIPASVTTIAPGNFVYWDDDDDGLRILPKLTIIGYKGSCAEDFAKNGYADGEDFVDRGATVIPFRALLDKATVTADEMTYTGASLKPAVTVKLGKATLVKGTDYTVSYKNNKDVGVATVTVKGVNGYAGTASGSFTIVPKPVTGLKLKAGKRQVTVSWKKGSGITGYQLEYGLKKDFTASKAVKVAKAATVKKVLKKLKSRKTYYFRLRAYKTVNKKTYWSKWSAVKKVKVK